jgi:hypothetical protein
MGKRGSCFYQVISSWLGWLALGDPRRNDHLRLFMLEWTHYNGCNLRQGFYSSWLPQRRVTY